MSLIYNERTRAFLENLGFHCEPEPDLVVKGRIPDFFCTGPPDIWVEVKSLVSRSEDIHRSRILNYLYKYQGKVTSGGRAIAYISGNATEQHAKAVLNLAKRALHKVDPTDFKQLAVVVPNDPDLSERLHMTYTSTKGTVLLFTYKSSLDQYGYPFSIAPKPYRQRVTLSADSVETHVWMDQIAKANNYLVGLDIYDFDHKPFTITAGMSSDPTMCLDTFGPVRGAIGDGNQQIKNGLRYREAPAALFLYQQGPLVPDDQGILAALFGDLEYVFQPELFQEGRLQFGRNGALRGEHSSISAVVFFRNEGVPLTVHNPWSARRLPNGVFGGREYVPLNDGTLQLREN